MNDIVKFAKIKILNILEERKFTMCKLAELSDLSVTCISNWYGKRNYVPSIDSLKKVCKGLGISLSQLICEDGEEMYPVNKELKNFLDSWVSLNEKQKNAVKTLIESYRD